MELSRIVLLVLAVTAVALATASTVLYSDRMRAFFFKPEPFFLMVQPGWKWSRHPPYDIPNLVNASNLTIIFDIAPCWFMAEGARDPSKAPQLHLTTGGEVIWCKNVLAILQQANRRALFVNDAAAFESLYVAARQARAKHVSLVHWGWNQLVMNQTVKPYGLAWLRPPFREGCILQMGFFGTDRPVELHFSNMRNYITVYPNGHNTYSGLPAPEVCMAPARSNVSSLRGPYGLVYGKWGITGDVSAILPMFRGEHLWRQVLKLTRIVFVRCTTPMVDALGIRRYVFASWERSTRVQCLNRVKQRPPYGELLQHASFVMGLGSPRLSPSPVEALYCKTPVISPASQHDFIASHASRPQFFDTATGDAVIAAVANVTAACTHFFVRAGEGFSKSSPCFEPGYRPPWQTALNSSHVLPQFEATLSQAEADCSAQG